MVDQSEESEAWMLSGSPGSVSLAGHVRHLPYAVATTTCRRTLAVLQRMLADAEARLHRQGKRLNPSDSKLL